MQVIDVHMPAYTGSLDWNELTKATRALRDLSKATGAAVLVTYPPRPTKRELNERDLDSAVASLARNNRVLRITYVGRNVSTRMSH